MTRGSKDRFTPAESVADVLPDQPRFAGVIRGLATKPLVQRGWVTPWATVLSVIRGGMLKRLRTSRSRTPATCTSTVGISAS